jgi:putative drug exporter of the RND superfamily
VNTNSGAHTPHSVLTGTGTAARISGTAGRHSSGTAAPHATGIPPRSALGRLAGWCYDHRRVVLIGWIVGVALVIWLAQLAGGRFDDSFSAGNSPSQQAENVLAQRFPAQAGDPADVVFRSSGKLSDPATAAVISQAVSALRPLPHVSGVISPLAPGTRQISADGRIGFIAVQFNETSASLPNSAVSGVVNTALRFARPGLQVAVGGSPVENVVSAAPGSSEGFGITAAIVIMLLAFGSVVAMGLPILTALAGVGAGFAVVELASHVLTVPTFGPEMMAMIGLGVGIDYALFIVTRYRQELHGGRSPRDAVTVAMSTAGRAVLFAGCTVVIALLGLFAVDLAFMDGLAASTILAVLLVLTGSMTLVPALLGFAGKAIDRLHIPGLLARPGGRAQARGRRAVAAPAATDGATAAGDGATAAGDGATAAGDGATAAGDGAITAGAPGREGFWYRWSRTVQRRPWLCGSAALAALVILAVPLLSMQFAFSDAGNDPQSLTTRQAYDLLSQGFGPGFNGPLVIAAELPGPRARAGVETLDARLHSVPGVASAGPAVLNQAGTAAVILVYPRTAPQAAQTAALVHRLRDQVIPQATAGSGAAVYVGGQTAGGIDASAFLSARLPWVIGLVIALAFVLLTVVFRSLVVPLKAALMNLLSIGAAYGVIVAVFQWGWLGPVFGVSRTGPIDPWIPMMMFTIVFGLSMDYEVFLLSRMREQWLRHGDSSRAVADGLADTARVITAAAAIMVCVFGSFVINDPLHILNVFGLGLAAAIFVDATLVRMVLVPSVMQLLGPANWWLPGWLRRVLPA